MNKALITKGRFLITLLSFLVVMMINATVFGQTSTSGTAYTWSTVSTWIPSGVPGANTSVTVNHPLTLDQSLTIGTGQYVFNQDITDQPGGTKYALTATTAAGLVEIKSGTTTIEGITSLTGSTLIVRSGATLILGSPGTPNTTNTLQIGNATTITVESGGTLIVYGSILNSNSSGSFSVNGLLQVYGDYKSNNGNINLSGSGQFFTSGAMDTQGSSLVYGSTNDCTSNCSGTNLGCAPNGGTAYTSIITPSSQTICSGGVPGQMTFSTNGTSPSFQWQSAASSAGTYTNISGATSSIYTPSPLTNTTWYRVQYSLSATGCSGLFSAPVSITVSASTSTQSTAGQTQCVGGGFSPISVTSAGTGLTYQWYSNTTASNSGGTSLGSSNGASTAVYTPQAVSGGTTYYYCVVNSSCSTPFTSAVSGAFLVNSSAPTIAGTTPGARCGTGTVTLGATASAGTINWYAASTGGSSLGTGTSFTTPGISANTTYYVDATNGCTTATRTAVTATINSNNTVGAASSSPTLCINTALTAITRTTTGATGIGTATGLPSGVSAAFGSNTITISGTPTASGTFNYSIPLTGGCGSVNAAGTIIVTPNNTVGAASSSPTLCINTALTAITHTTTGATGIGTATGLPAGVSAAFGSNTITISGTPIASGTFSYSIPLTGGCGSVNATGTITVSGSTLWIGPPNGLWNDAANWSCGILPTAAVDVDIPTGASPQVPANTAVNVKALTINGTLNNLSVLNVYGNFVNNGTFNNTAQGTVSFLGSTQTISGTSVTSFYNITVGATVTLSSNANLYGTLNVSSGQFNAGGTLTTPLLTLKSTSITQNGSIGAMPSPTSFIGFVKAERYMDALGGTFRYISSPVKSSPSKPTGIDKIYAYSNGWVGASTLEPGKGYAALVYNNAAVTWSVIGETNTDNAVWSFSAEGWYLIGNPYPSAIQWKDPVTNSASWSMTNIATTIGITDNHSGSYPSYFKYYDYKGSNPGWGDGVIPNGTIAMGQAFWVYAGAGGSITVKQPAKSAANGIFYRQSNEIKFDQMSIILSNDKFGDQALLRIDERSTEGFEFNVDLPKLWNEEMNVYLLDNTKREMLINAVPKMDESVKIPVGITVTEPGSYTLSFANVENFSAGNSLFLVDKQEGVSIPVTSTQPYTFTIKEAGKPITERFYLKRVPDAGLNTEVSVSIYPNPVIDNKLNVELLGAGQHSSITLMDVNGKVLMTGDVTGMNTIDMIDYPAGLYILKVKTDQGLLIRKIMKQ